MEMASPRTYTQDLLPESALPEELAEQGLYKPAGMGCEHCEFATKKTGLSGRQALRAHLKRHKNDARAWRGPMIRQGLVAGSIVTLVAIGMIGSTELKADLHSTLSVGRPLATFPTAIMSWGPLAGAVGLIMASWYMLLVPGEIGGQPLARVLSGLRIAGCLLGLWVVVGAWGVVDSELSWAMMAPVLVLIVLTPVLAAKAGMVRLLVRRRGVRSGSYSTLVSPKDALANAEAFLWWKSRQRKEHH